MRGKLMKKLMKRMIRQYSNMQFGVKLFLSSVILTSLTIFLICVPSYIISEHYISSLSLEYMHSLVHQISRNLITTMDNINETLFLNYENGPYVNFQFEPDKTGERNLKYQNAVNYLLSTKPYYGFVLFVDQNKNSYYAKAADDESHSQPPIDISKDEARLKSLWGKSEWTPGDENHIYLKRAIYSITTSRYLGFIVVGIKSSYLKSLYKQDSNVNGEQLFVLNKDGQVILYPSEESRQLAETVFPQVNQNDDNVYYKGQNYIAVVTEMSDTQIKVLAVNSSKNVFRSMNTIQYLVLLVCAVVLAITVVIALFNSKMIAGRVKTLTSSFQELAHGDFSSRIELSSTDEFGQLAVNFNSMADKIQRLMREVTQEQLQKQTAEYQLLQFRYQTLQSELNPHFLYNVLDSVNSIAKIHDEALISEIICQLCDLLRENINRKNKLIPLEKEIDFVSKYTALYEIICGNRITFEYHLDQDLNTAPVPNLILQPIVENAIIHGLEGKSGKGVVSISSRKAAEGILLEVSDNGIGMDPQKLEEIQRLLRHESTATDARHTRVGLSGVQDRVSLMYGEKFGLRITSKPGLGTLVQLLLPLRREPPQEGLGPIKKADDTGMVTLT